MLFQVSLEVQHGEISYTQRQWIEADNLDHAQEVGEQFADLCNEDENDFRLYRLKAVDPKPLIEKRVRQRSSGLTETQIEEIGSGGR